MSEKYEKLKQILSGYDGLIVAFSGGVDSSFLLAVAHEVLGEKALGITIKTPYVADWELEDAKSVAAQIGANHLILSLPFLDSLHSNPVDRCYICKHSLFSFLLSFAQKNNFSVVTEGSNVDDMGEHRPGRRALGELEIKTPLLEAGLTKSDIRKLSLKLGLSTHDKPSYACMLTRFNHDEMVNIESLKMIESAEKILIDNGFRQMRVRFEQFLARIEMSKDDAQRFLGSQSYEKIVSEIKRIGFKQITLDLQGYKHG